MNENTLRRIIAITNLGFAFFCLLWVALSLLFLPIVAGQKDYTLLIKDPEWFIITLAGLLSAVLGIFAVFGIYLANREHQSELLLSGIVLLVLGLIFETASLTWDALIWPVLCADAAYASFISDGVLLNSLPFMVFYFALIGLLLLGSILTALALYKTRKYGKLIPLLITTGITLYIAGNFVSLHTALVGLSLNSFAYLLLGLKLWKNE